MAKLILDPVEQIQAIDFPDFLSKFNFVYNKLLDDKFNLIEGYTDIWNDYSETSTILGFSSFTTKQIFYTKINKFVFVTFYLQGVSNSNAAVFSLPIAPAKVNVLVNCPVADNSVSLTTPGTLQMIAGDYNATCYLDGAFTGFTPVGTKRVSGQFFYESVGL